MKELRNAETQTGEIRGGARRSNATLTMDRKPQTPKEVDTVFNCLILRIMNNLKSKLIGINNTGATCYMNSLIQALHNIETFKESIIRYCAEGNTIATTTRVIFKALETKQYIKGAWYINIEDTNIFQQLQFDPRIQSDPNEVFLSLINKLKDVDYHIAELCEYCEIKHIDNPENETVAVNNVINISIPEDGDGITDSYNIEDLLSKEITREVIDEESNRRGNAILTISWDFLCLNIQRPTKYFSNDMYKLNARKMIAIQGTIYELKSIIVHHGTEVEAGHYTTYNIKGSNTYHINDIVASSSNIKLNKTYVSCDNITEDGRMAMVFYEKIKDQSVEVIRASMPTIEQPESRANQISISVTQSQQMNTYIQQQDNTNNQNCDERQTSQETSTFTTMQDPLPIVTLNEEDNDLIREINTRVNQKLSEAHNPNEFMEKISELKTDIYVWNTKPKLH